jgi:hypothetical protein
MAKRKENETDKGKSKPGLVGTHGYRKPEKIKTHPELKELYLRISKDEEAISEGMKSGFLEDRPATLVKGPWTDGEEVIADGHTRIDLAIKNGVKEVPVVVHETETLLDAVALVFGIDFRQRKRHEVIHLIHLLEKIQPLVSSISDAAKKPKGKLSALLGRWIGTGSATVERMQSILKNPEAKAYVEKHKDERLSILKIYDMFKDKGDGDGPSAPKGKGEQTPPVPPAPPAGEGEGRKKCFGTHPGGIDQDCLLCPDECECEAATATSAGQGQGETPPAEPTGRKTACMMFGTYDPDTCIKECKDIEQCKAKTEADNAPQPPPPAEEEAKPAQVNPPKGFDCFGDYPMATDGNRCKDCKEKYDIVACLNATHVSLLNDVAGLKSKIAKAEAEGDDKGVKVYKENLEPYPSRIERLITVKVQCGVDNASQPPERSPEEWACYGDYVQEEDEGCTTMKCTCKFGCASQTLENLLNDKADCESKIADAETRGDVEEVKKLRDYIESHEKQIEETAAIKAEIEKAALDALAALEDAPVVEPTIEDVSPDEGEEPPVRVDPETGHVSRITGEGAEFLASLPPWLFKFLNGNLEDFKRCRWIAIGEGSVPEIDDSEAMIETNPDNPPPTKAEEKKAAKKGLSKPEIKKLANKKASKAAADTVHKAASKGKKAVGATA